MHLLLLFHAYEVPQLKQLLMSFRTMELSQLTKEMKLDMKTTKLLIGMGRGRKQRAHMKKLLRRRSLKKLFCQGLM